MRHFLPKAVIDMTGIPRHSLMSWSQKYNFPPVKRRTPAGARLYSDFDVEQLRMAKEYIERGFAISELVEDSLFKKPEMVAQTTMVAPLGLEPR